MLLAPHACFRAGEAKHASFYGGDAKAGVPHPSLVQPSRPLGCNPPSPSAWMRGRVRGNRLCETLLEFLVGVFEATTGSTKIDFLRKSLMSSPTLKSCADKTEMCFHYGRFSTNSYCYVLDNSTYLKKIC